MRIGCVIVNCNKCHHLRSTQEIGGNTYFAAICRHTEGKEFLVGVFSNHPLQYKIDIPENCPLEYYRGDGTAIEPEGEEDEWR